MYDLISNLCDDSCVQYKSKTSPHFYNSVMLCGIHDVNKQLGILGI